jgi:DNA helicase-2/ATP-dependent DNA helicase PcrA
VKYSNLNKNQELSVESPLGPVLVIAGAGTGKTKVLTHRIIFLIEELSFKPHEILAITFSNKASNEMKKRIESLCHYEPIIGTYHSICLKILKEDIKYLNRGVNFNVIDDEDQISLIKDFVRAANASENSLTPRKILGVINNVKTNLLDLSNVNDPKALRTIGLSKFEDLKIIRYVKKLYDDYMVQNNLLDYDDLLILTHKLLTQEASVRTK